MVICSINLLQITSCTQFEFLKLLEVKMEIEKWECNKCGSPCRVEIEFDGKGPAGKEDRFRGRCICGTYDYPEDRIPDWKKLELLTTAVSCNTAGTENK